MYEHKEFMKFFPSKFPKGRLPDRKYFFNIMNTVMEEYVQQLISHAHKVRANKVHEFEAALTIEVTDAWYEKLKAIPFVSRKFKLSFICL